MGSWKREINSPVKIISSFATSTYTCKKCLALFTENSAERVRPLQQVQIDIMKTVAVVPSAGRGVRIGSCQAKPYIKLAGKPILAHTLQALNNSSCIDGIIVAVDKTNKERTKSIVKRYKVGKLKCIVIGGATRFKSVANCLKYLDENTEYVVIHDGIRPFIAEDMIRRALRVAKRVGACVVGLPLVPTLKKVDSKKSVISTPSRQQFWTAQTPQVFKKSLIVKAYNLAEKRKIFPTDDSMLVELLGKKVKMIKGSYSNIKITRPVDLELAEVLVKQRK